MCVVAWVVVGSGVSPAGAQPASPAAADPAVRGAAQRQPGVSAQIAAVGGVAVELGARTFSLRSRILVDVAVELGARTFSLQSTTAEGVAVELGERTFSPRSPIAENAAVDLGLRTSRPRWTIPEDVAVELGRGPNSPPSQQVLRPWGWTSPGDFIPPVPPLRDVDAASALVLPRPLRRPAPLVPLYVSFAALQVLDTTSTHRALREGGREANPVVQGFAGNRAAMLAVKAGATAATVYLTERLWKKSRPAAIVLMTALNGAYAAILAHNIGQF